MIHYAVGFVPHKHASLGIH